MEFNKIAHNRLYKDVLMQLKEYININGLKAGDKLPTERDIADQLGISRGTLREAFRVLESNGILDVTQGGGRYLKRDFEQSSQMIELVNAFEYEDTLDLMELREVIEQRIVELVIERAGDDELKEIEKSMYQGNDLFLQDNTFHLALARASHNLAFYNVMNLNLSKLQQIRRKSLQKSDRAQQMSQEHMKLLDAIKARDVKLAKIFLAEHLIAVARSFKKNPE